MHAWEKSIYCSLTAASSWKQALLFCVIDIVSLPCYWEFYQLGYSSQWLAFCEDLIHAPHDACYIGQVIRSKIWWHADRFAFFWMQLLAVLNLKVEGSPQMKHFQMVSLTKLQSFAQLLLKSSFQNPKWHIYWLSGLLMSHSWKDKCWQKLNISGNLFSLCQYAFAISKLK